MKKTKKLLFFTITELLISVLFTILTFFVDKQAVGPKNTAVGFATINKFFANKLGFNNNFYVLTKYLGWLPILLAALILCFTILKILKEKNILKNSTWVAASITIALTFGLYVFFKIIVVNYRPVLSNGVLEASFPSSHTLFAVSFMLISAFCTKEFISNKNSKSILSFASYLLCIVIVAGRFFSGVHWFTDIIGGVLWGAFLYLLFCLIKSFLQQKQTNTKNK